MFPEGSFAVTVKVNGLPATEDAGTEVNTRLATGAEETETAEEVTERVPSDAVRVWEPEVFRVIGKVPFPLVREVAGGRIDWESLEVMETDPA